MKLSILTFLMLISFNFAKGQGLTIPIEGVYGVDYIIVNYPDWHEDDGPILVEDGFLVDHMCGTKTYDGHQGTDFVITGFPQMDASVNVLAIEDGEVIHVTEDLFDRETDGIVAYGLGNYVGIYHSVSNTYSYYAHLKTSSVIVEEGDFVTAGQVIGEVGSSGNSTDPHLHFELWNPGMVTDPTIDPWGTPCDEGSSLWASAPVYDTAFAVWECGFVNYDTLDNFNPSTWYPLKERLDPKSGFTVDDPFFTFWCLQYGLKMGDETSIEWYEPSGDLYSTSTTSYSTQDWWYHYYHNSIPLPPSSKQGVWTVRYFYNDSLQLEKTFSYGDLSFDENGSSSSNPFYYKVDERTLIVVLPDVNLYSNLSIYSVTGEVLLEKQLGGDQEIELELPKHFKGGNYILSLYNNNERYILKVVLE